MKRGKRRQDPLWMLPKMAPISENQLLKLRESYIEAEAGRILATVSDPTEEEIRMAYDKARRSLSKILE